MKEWSIIYCKKFCEFAVKAKKDSQIKINKRGRIFYKERSTRLETRIKEFIVPNILKEIKSTDLINDMYYKDLSESQYHLLNMNCDKTRKMVNYTWNEWSRRKLWWKFLLQLTCKSLTKVEYRGERLIEPFSSWFALNIPLGRQKHKRDFVW